MVKASQKSVLGMSLEQSLLFGASYKPMVNTTLNEKFAVEGDTSLPAGQLPYVQYFCIGIGGRRFITGETDTTPEYTYSEHSPLDAALFQHIPFIIRETTSDLTANERTNYRMRKLETFNGKEYYAYYLKKTPTPEIKDVIHVIQTLNDGTSVSSPTMSVLDTSTTKFLNPSPITTKFEFKDLDKTRFVTKLNKLSFTLTTQEMDELMNVFKVMNINTTTDAYITEIGLCSGLDQEVGQGANKRIEAICAQICFFLSVSYNITEELRKNRTLNKSINLGGMEPMLYPEGD